MDQINNRLRWACRRGMLELDVLLGNFLTEGYLQLSAAEQQQFEDLLLCEDQDLFEWLTAHKTAPPIYQNMIKKIQLHAQTRHKP